MNKSQRLLKLAYRKGYRVRKDGTLENASGVELSVVIKIDRRSLDKRQVFNLKDPFDKKAYPIPVHRLQAFQKFGEAMFVKGIQVRHKNGHSLDNSEENILIGTMSQNMMDKPKKERKRLAGNANRKHSPELISKIQAEHEAGMSYKKLSAKYGLSKSMLSFHLSKTAKRKVVVGLN